MNPFNFQPTESLIIFKDISAYAPVQLLFCFFVCFQCWFTAFRRLLFYVHSNRITIQEWMHKQHFHSSERVSSVPDDLPADCGWSLLSATLATFQPLFLSYFWGTNKITGVTEQWETTLIRHKIILYRLLRENILITGFTQNYILPRN